MESNNDFPTQLFGQWANNRPRNTSQMSFQREYSPLLVNRRDYVSNGVRNHSESQIAAHNSAKRPTPHQKRPQQPQKQLQNRYMYMPIQLPATITRM
jgi:hypothetical protein